MDAQIIAMDSQDIDRRLDALVRILVDSVQAGDVLRLLEALRQCGAPLMPPELAAEMGRDQIEGLVMEGSLGWCRGIAGNLALGWGLWP